MNRWEGFTTKELETIYSALHAVDGDSACLEAQVSREIIRRDNLVWQPNDRDAAELFEKGRAILRGDAK